jgi:hypothetical protein
MLVNARNEGTELLRMVGRKFTSADNVPASMPVRFIKDFPADIAFPSCTPTLAIQVVDLMQLRALGVEGNTGRATIEGVERLQQVFKHAFCICVEKHDNNADTYATVDDSSHMSPNDQYFHTSPGVRPVFQSFFEEQVAPGNCRFLYCGSMEEVPALVLQCFTAFVNKDKADYQRHYYEGERAATGSRERLRQLSQQVLADISACDPQAILPLLATEGLSVARLSQLDPLAITALLQGRGQGQASQQGLEQHQVHQQHLVPAQDIAQAIDAFFGA